VERLSSKLVDFPPDQNLSNDEHVKSIAINQSEYLKNYIKLNEFKNETALNVWRKIRIRNGSKPKLATEWFTSELAKEWLI